jgi:hypothetical protein
MDGSSGRNMKLILIVVRRSHRQAFEMDRLPSDLLVLTVFGGNQDVVFKQQLK